jgi:hypothetical protein
VPGDSITITVELITPGGRRRPAFAGIREGGRTVGAGQVTEVLDDSGLIGKKLSRLFGGGFFTTETEQDICFSLFSWWRTKTLAKT